MNRILRMPAVVERTGLSRAMIYIRIGKGSFPQSIPIGPNSVGWLESEINDWIMERVNERDKKLSA